MPQSKDGRYLRQLGSGHIYAWTPTLSKRKDMQEIDQESARVRIDALKEQMATRIANMKDPSRIASAKARIEAITKLSAELAALEGNIAADEEAQKKESEAAILGEKPKLRPDDIDTSKKGEVDTALAEEDRKSRVLAEDKEYQSILAMKTNQAIVDYLAAKFGLRENARQPIEKLRFVALEKRKERVFEV